MIIQALLDFFQGAIKFLLNILPNIPQMPSGIQAGLNGITTTIGQVTGVIAYIYTPVILIFVFTAIVAVLSFDSVYKLVLWIWHKIRG